MATTRQKERQERFKEWLLRDDVKTALLKYAEHYGVTAATREYRTEKEERDALTTQLWDTYDRVWAHKILQSFRNRNLTARVDGTFITGGTRASVEIKGRCYDITPDTEDWAWTVDELKYEDMVEDGGYLFYLWIPDDGIYMDVDYALWNVNVTPPDDVPMKCSKSVTCTGRGDKEIIQKGWYLKDAVIRGHASGRLQEGNH